MAAPGDDELLDRIGRGDQVAFAQLYDRHAGWILLRLRRRCSDSGLAEEALQDTFLSVWRHAGTFRSVGPSAGGWLWTLANRRLVDSLRAAARVATPVEQVHEHVGPGLEEVLVTELAHGDMAEALALLPPELRRVVQATVLDGLTTREAAVLLGIPEGTVKTRAARARVQLRAGLA